MPTIAERHKIAEREAPAGECKALADNLCWLLSQASYALLTEQAAALEELGISPRAYSVLTAAIDAERTQIELARTVGLDKTTMVVTVDELEATGLAERRPSKTDRRARVIAVTAKGRRKVRDAEEIVRRIHADVLDSLAPGKRAAFMSALRSLVEGRLSKPAKCAEAPRRRAPRA